MNDSNDYALVKFQMNREKISERIDNDMNSKPSQPLRLFPDDIISKVNDTESKSSIMFS
jgi:hypothetical protein